MVVHPGFCCRCSSSCSGDDPWLGGDSEPDLMWASDEDEEAGPEEEWEDEDVHNNDDDMLEWPLGVREYK